MSRRESLGVSMLMLNAFTSTTYFHTGVSLYMYMLIHTVNLHLAQSERPFTIARVLACLEEPNPDRLRYCSDTEEKVFEHRCAGTVDCT